MTWKKSRFEIGLFIVVTVVTVALDQGTKAYIVGHLQVHEIRHIIPGFFDIVHFRNTGAAFGVLGGTFSRNKHLFFCGASILALGAILLYMFKARKLKEAEITPLALIFAGALGNLIDRIRFREVVDFLYLHWHKYYWPAFNVADSAITIGALLLLLAFFKK